MAQCDGSGFCLTTKIGCEMGCTRRECPNFFICGNEEPQFILDFNRGVCTECSTRVGRSLENNSPSNPVLEVKEDVECPVCFQTSQCIKNPRCTHYLCMKCMKAIYWYDDSLDGLIPRPEFPRPNEEDTFYQYPDLFVNDDLVNQWKQRIGSWNEERVWYVVHNKRYLKRCPICRA